MLLQMRYMEVTVQMKLVSELTEAKFIGTVGTHVFKNIKITLQFTLNQLITTMEYVKLKIIHALQPMYCVISNLKLILVSALLQQILVNTIVIQMHIKIIKTDHKLHLPSSTTHVCTKLLALTCLLMKNKGIDVKMILIMQQKKQLGELGMKWNLYLRSPSPKTTPALKIQTQTQTLSLTQFKVNRCGHTLQELYCMA